MKTRTATGRLHVALQRVERADAWVALAASEAEVGAGMIAALRAANGDFSNAIRTSPEGTLPTVGVYPYRSGPFTDDGARLKNEYVWVLERGEIDRYDLRIDHLAPRHVTR
ncbi:hypothetical protein [Demequina litorisediminis]|uniref:Uncharacterized protein n=1 Tax=Demequina litorisediminis TaxID=1849022 RepID=A0ABQ6IBH8_9MICO|nr:hypothetical protein [Demequina litorisediminis]GMA34094.1 hypothetical protein GCM10025876_02980 [Demequina litorisediminis]